MLAQFISQNSKVDISLLSPIVVNDAEFKSAFSEKSFPYNSRNVKVIRYILGKIERFKGSLKTVRFDDDSASIEHIYPQSPDESWTLDDSKMQRFTYRLGNMCLLEKTINKEVENKAYSIKRTEYANSSYYYAKHISTEYDDWDDKSIVRMQAEQATAAVSIWKV